MSGAYLGPEFTAEFGQLPPAFLPMGNRRLWEWQVDSFAELETEIVLSVPEDFQLLDDEELLSARGVSVIRVPPGLSLGQSVVFCLNVLGSHSKPLRILYGDTMVSPGASEPEDFIGLAQTREYYEWAEVIRDAGGIRFKEGLPAGLVSRTVLCGYFRFADPTYLIQCVTKSGGRFIAGLEMYCNARAAEAIEVADWCDFGHVHLYYQSKSKKTTQRSFNSIGIVSNSLLKSSGDANKIDAEATWYETASPEVSLHLPRFVGRERDGAGNNGYRLEYLHLSTLSELLVFGRLPSFVWSKILEKCEEFLLVSSAAGGDFTYNPQAFDLRQKTLGRLEQFARAADLDMDADCRINGAPLPSLRRMTETLNQAITPATAEDVGRWHGDFCFSNIFYDFRSSSIKTIDPRGLGFDGAISMLGDMRYDMAKLAHSAIGGYDFIIAGRFDLSRAGPLDFGLDLPSGRPSEGLRQEFRDIVGRRGEAQVQAILATMISLFLSMLPLHADHPTRQLALLSNALRLYRRFEEGSLL